MARIRAHIKDDDDEGFELTIVTDEMAYDQAYHISHPWEDAYEAYDRFCDSINGNDKLRNRPNWYINKLEVLR